ncbi:MAG: PilZ domain-containing protein [Actinomycetota bacterium]|nr:PilZ domain-containing protein [Actinomycetota bacterium]
MSRRALRAGDHIWIEAQSPNGPRRVDTQLVARDDDQLLVLCHADDLTDLELAADLVVAGSWRRDEGREFANLRISHLATYPVGTMVLIDEAHPADEVRRSPRLHRVLPAQLWTPDTGHLPATIVDLSVGGARLRLRERPPSLSCEVILGAEDDAIELGATVLEIVPAGVTGLHHEVRLQFNDPGPDQVDRLHQTVEHGVADAIAELGVDARRAVEPK